MAAFNPQYVNLDKYEAAQIARRANQLSPLDALLNGAQQGLELQQLPGKLQDQALARELQNAMNQQKLYDLQHPDAAFARKLQEELAMKGALNPDLGITRAEPGLVGQTIANPGAITSEQQAALPSQETMALRQAARDAGGVDIPTVIPTAKAGANETPISFNGIQTGLNSNPNIPLNAKQSKLDAQIAAINARATAAGVPLRYEADINGNLIAVPTRQIGTSAPTASNVTNTTTGEDVKVPPKSSKATSITGNEIAKTISEAGLVGVRYDQSIYGDLTNPVNYSRFKNDINDANDAKGSVSDPKLKTIAIRIQNNFNKEPVVSTKKNLEIFGKEASDAIQHIIDHPDEPAGARQIEAFDSFIKAFSAGKPTVAQYGQIEQYQSVENYIKNYTDRLTTGKHLTNEELLTYADAIKTASQSIDSAYQEKVKQYRDEAVGYGITAKAVKNIIKSEGGETLTPRTTDESGKPVSLKISGTSGTSSDGIKFKLIKK